MPRLAPFSAPRERSGTTSDALVRRAPFVPGWMRALAATASMPIVAQTPVPSAAAAPVQTWRGAEPAAGEPESMPAPRSIDAYFASPVEAPAVELSAPAPVDPYFAPPVEAFFAPAVAETPTSPPQDDAEATDWSLAAAAAEIESLAQALAAGVRRPTPAQLRAIDDAARFGLDAALVEPAGPAPLAAWSDDDLMEIMPAPRAPAVEATPAHEAARVIEGVAARVRRGEVTLPSYVRGMGDAATLAAALAALLAPER
ncbi:MAG: hypothetical protein MUE41_15770 [Gemmatimonadaceae bacterium]|nr:hypothetical protein [Gemmatimonadaceae bacterium]